MQETAVWFLGWKDSLEEGMATHSHIRAWGIPQREQPVGLQSMGVAESDTTEWLSMHSILPDNKAYSSVMLIKIVCYYRMTYKSMKQNETHRNITTNVLN